MRLVKSSLYVGTKPLCLRSLAAFEKSEHPDDWRELMRLFMVRRTRSFIRDNKAYIDKRMGSKFFAFSDGRQAYFPTQHPKTVRFAVDESNSHDQYGQLYTDNVVELINQLNLPRYGLGNYQNKRVQANSQKQKTLKNLSRGGRRLVGLVGQAYSSVLRAAITRFCSQLSVTRVVSAGLTRVSLKRACSRRCALIVVTCSSFCRTSVNGM